jgi:hypothetical protein
MATPFASACASFAARGTWIRGFTLKGLQLDAMKASNMTKTSANECWERGRLARGLTQSITPRETSGLAAFLGICIVVMLSHAHLGVNLRRLSRLC